MTLLLLPDLFHAHMLLSPELSACSTGAVAPFNCSEKNRASKYEISAINLGRKIDSIYEFPHKKVSQEMEAFAKMSSCF